MKKEPPTPQEINKKLFTLCSELWQLRHEVKAQGTLLESFNGDYTLDSESLLGLGLALNRVSKKMEHLQYRLENINKAFAEG